MSTSIQGHEKIFRNSPYIFRLAPIETRSRISNLNMQAYAPNAHRLVLLLEISLGTKLGFDLRLGTLLLRLNGPEDEWTTVFFVKDVIVHVLCHSQHACV